MQGLIKELTGGAAGIGLKESGGARYTDGAVSCAPNAGIVNVIKRRLRMTYYCPIPQSDDLADDVKVVCTTHNGPAKWSCDECPDLDSWRKLHRRRRAYVERKLAVHRPGILKKAKERVT